MLKLTVIYSWGNLNGVVSSNIYRQQDAPNYRPGHGVVLAYLVLFLFGGSILTTVGLRIENKKRQSGQRDHWVQGKSESEVNIMGDKRYVISFPSYLLGDPDECRPDFIYTV